MYFRRRLKCERKPSESIWICSEKPGGRSYNDAVDRIIISIHEINKSLDSISHEFIKSTLH